MALERKAHFTIPLTCLPLHELSRFITVTYIISNIFELASQPMSASSALSFTYTTDDTTLMIDGLYFDAHRHDIYAA